MPDGQEDIVDRLRRQVELIPGLSPEPPEDDLTASDRLWFTVQDAADEIERLRRLLSEKGTD